MSDPVRRRSSARATRSRAIGLLHRFFNAIATSRINYGLAFAADLGCALAFAYGGVRSNADSFSALASLGAGAFMFSFVEYAYHRWLFHAHAPVFTEIHASHHREPQAPSAIPFWSSVVAAPIFFWLLAQVFEAAVAHFILCGFFMAYFIYGLIHHLQHRIQIKNVPSWLRGRWAAHAIHHGRGNVNFGVTNSLWDRVFRTYCAPPRR